MMVIKLEADLTKRLKAQDQTVLKRVLEEIDIKIIEQLKKSKEDVRYIQGYSAAVDYINSLLK